MPAAQLKETTMNPKTRCLIRVCLPKNEMAALGLSTELVLDNQEENTAQPGPNTAAVDDLVERLMGRQAESRFEFIQDNAEFVQDLDI